MYSKSWSLELSCVNTSRMRMWIVQILLVFKWWNMLWQCTTSYGNGISPTFFMSYIVNECPSRQPFWICNFSECCVDNRKFFFLNEPEVAQSSLRLIQQCLLDEDSKKTPLAQDSLDHLAANGVSHKSDKISMETMKLIPGIYVQNIEVSYSYSQIGHTI